MTATTAITAGVPVRSGLEAAPAPENPYKFLDYFHDSPEDRRRFGGRDREVHDIVTRATNERTLVLYGPSGIGKTSLLLAGVFPALEERQVRPVYARVLTSPLADLGRALSAQPGETLRDTLARLAAAGPLALFLDQFEELFIRFRDQPEARAAFAEAVGAVVSDTSLDVTVVFSLREDYLASLDELSTQMKDLLADRYRLQPLTAFGVRQAVTRPLVDAGIPFEPAVVSGLIRALEEVDFEPPVLQIFCSELYKEAVKRAGGALPRITVADLERLGGCDNVFRRYLEGVAKALPTEWNLLTRIVLDSLITREGTKRATTLADLLNLDFSAGEKEVVEILDLLVQHRLVRRQEKDGEVWYELIHERLISVVSDWLALDREFFQFRQARAFVADNAASGLWQSSPDTLISAGALTNLIGPYRERFRFSERELELLVRSAIYQQSPELSCWSVPYGMARTKEILLKTLESGTEAERRSAVASARFFKGKDEDGRLARACLKTALEDPAEPVWREAAVSLAGLARPEEAAALKNAVEDLRRDRASQVLVEMAGQGHGLDGLTWSQRRRVRRMLRRRVAQEQSGALIKRQWSGFGHGAWAGLAASVPFQLPLFLLEGNGLTWASLSLVIAFSGAIYGGLTAYFAAMDAACRRTEGNWLASLRHPLFLLYLFFIFGYAVGITGACVSGDGVRAAVFGCLVFPVSLAGVLLLPVAVAQWTRPFVMKDPRKARVFLRMLLVSVAVPVPLTLGAALVLSVVAVPALSGVLLWISTNCWLTCVVGTALALSSLKHPFGDFLPARGLWARWAGVRQDVRS